MANPLRGRSGGGGSGGGIPLPLRGRGEACDGLRSLADSLAPPVATFLRPAGAKRGARGSAKGPGGGNRARTVCPVAIAVALLSAGIWQSRC